MTDVYQICNWSKHFENNKSRILERCSYVCMPNKQDGLGLNRILARPDGTAIFGVWVLILQACSRQKKREGWLTDDGTQNGPVWTAEDLAFRWRRPVAEITTALDFLCSDKISWVHKLADKCPSGGTDPAPDGQKTFMRRKERTKERTASAEECEREENLGEPSQQPSIKTDEDIYRIASLHVEWRVKNPERAAENRQNLIEIFRVHSEIAKSIAESHRHQTGKKIMVWELESMIGEKLKAPAHGEPKEKLVGIRLINQHGWEACREAGKCSAIKNAGDMLNAMLANGEIYRLVTERFGAA